MIEDEWAAGLIRSWEHWLDLPRRVGDELAPLLGSHPGEVVVHDSVSVNLYQLVHAALRLRADRRVIAIDPGEFPSDRWVVHGIAAATGCSVRGELERLDDVAVVVRSMVDYRTAEVANLVSETDRARDAGTLVVWDLSHAAGVLELDLPAAGVELAVGCTYKYLNGGPGSPGFSYVARDLVGRVDEPIHGWFGSRDQFAMGPHHEPHADSRRLLIGTPGIIGLTAARVGIGLTAEAGIAAIAAKARALTAFALECCDTLGLATVTPRDPRRRGGHVSVRANGAGELSRTLANECGVIVDFREPGLLRLGCSPLTTRFADVERGTRAIAELGGL